MDPGAAPGRRQGGLRLPEPSRLVAYWLGGHGTFVTDLADIRSWDLSSDARGGPILRIETPTGDLRTQFPTGSDAVTTQVKRFLEAFTRSSSQTFRSPSTTGDETPLREINGITAEEKSWGRRTRRILVTLVGAALTIVGVVLAVPLVPGPGLLVAVGGVALLASEYDWAKDALNWAQDKSRGSKERLKARRRHPAD